MKSKSKTKNSRTCQKRSKKSTSTTNNQTELLEHFPNKEKDFCKIKPTKKPDFNLDFLKETDNKTSSLLSNVSDFLSNIPGPSNSSDRSNSTNLTISTTNDSGVFSNLKSPKNIEEIEDCWKKAAVELAEDEDSDQEDQEKMENITMEHEELEKFTSENDTEHIKNVIRKAAQTKNIEFQMSICPFAQIPKALLPVVSDEDCSSEDSSVGEMSQRKIQVIEEGIME